MFPANQVMKFCIGGENLDKKIAGFEASEDLPGLCLQQRALYS